MDYDDCFLDDDSLNEEAAMNRIEEAKLEVINRIEELVTETKRNLQYKEKSDFSSNLQILSRYVMAMFSLEELINGPEETEDDLGNAVTEEKMSEDEILDHIDEILLNVKEMTFTDLKEYEEKQNTIQVNPLPKEDEDDGFGF